MKTTKIDETEMFAFFEMTPDLVCITGRDGYFKKINPAVCNTLGYTEEELLSNAVVTFIHPDDKLYTSNARKELLNGKALLNFQNRYCKKNGEIVWLEWTSVYVPDKELVFAIAKNINSRKQVENEIEEKYKKFKNLATHFKNSIEKDRKFLSIELHEELAQLASVVKMDVDHIKSQLPLNFDFSKSRIDHALATSDLLINTLRKISFSISPNMIDDMGINEVLRCLCNEFSNLNGIPCTYKYAFDETTLTHEIQLDIFRICQQSLTNAMYNTVVESIDINIEEEADSILLDITLYGSGLEFENEKELAGLTSIRERAASINGQLVIEKEKGKRKKISVTIQKD